MSSQQTSVKRVNPRKIAHKFLLYFFSSILLIWILLPFFYTLGSAFSPASEIGKRPTPFWPADPTLDNFKIVLGLPVQQQDCSAQGAGIDLCNTAEINISVQAILTTMWNSFYIGCLVVGITLIFAIFSAYSLSRYRFAGARFFQNFIILSRIVPGLVLIAPIFIVLRVTNLLNTSWALVITYVSFTLPLAIIILKFYFDQITSELDEAAAIDGANRFQIIFSIILPVAVPGLIATGVLVFLESWGEFFFSLVLTASLTVPPLLAGFLSLQTFSWTLLSAATVIAVLPPILLTMVFQKYLVSALAAGSGK